MSSQQETLTVQQALNRAAKFFNAGRMTEAVEIYQRILEAEPDNADAHHNLAIAWNILGKSQNAASSYRRALAVRPECVETRNNLGLTLCRIGSIHDGIAEYRNALAINAGFFDAHVNLGVALCTIGKYDEAVTSYEKALTIQPENIVALMNLGDALRGTGRLDNAVDTYKSVVELDPNNAKAHNEMGNALRSLGRLDEAIVSYRMAYDADPDFDIARRNEGSTLQEHGRLNEAIDSLRKANTSLSRANLLECIFETMNKEEFYQELERIAVEDKVNIGVAAISAYASHQFGSEDPYPFCVNPLDFVSIKNIKTSSEEGRDLVGSVRNQILEMDLDSGHQSLLNSGFQSGPSLFVDPRGPIAKLRAMLQDEVKSYRSGRADSDCLFVKEWPENSNMSAWYVLMEQGGHLTMHNHPAGWLSGVIYLEMPNRSGDEANIEFGLHGNNLPIVDHNYPKKVYQVTEGDLILFPSSLFHRTLPFHSKGNRLCVSFDLNPV